MIPAALVERARDADIVVAAERLGATLKRASAIERAGPCLVCGGHDRFAVNTRKQTWNCRGCNQGGNVIALVMHIRGCNFREAVGFLTGAVSMAEPQSPLTYVRPKPPPSDPRVRSPGEKDNVFVAQLAADLVRELVPLIGTPGELYLAEVRKIDTDAIADVLERTDAIGWHPSVLLREESHALDRRRLGCIIGMMTDPVTAMPTGAISRTYLFEGRKVGKAKTLGVPAGIVRLSLDEDVLGGLHLGEGLETALDAMARGFRPMWSTGSKSLMAKFPVLSGVEALTIIADNDANGAGTIAADEAAAHWLEAGRETHVYQREIEGDLNDAFREGRR